MATTADRVLIAAVAVVVVAAGVAAVAAGQRRPVDLDADSPEATVQQYVQAVVAGDVDTAVGLLDTEGPCTVDDLTVAWVADDLRATLVSTAEVGEDRAVVVVAVTEGSSDPFGRGWTHDERFALTRAGTDWVITGAPWPMYTCTKEVEP